MKQKLFLSLSKLNNKPPYISLIIVVAFITTSAINIFLAWNYALTERFGDEINHFIAGTLWHRGLIPYVDMQLNHQPLIYVFTLIIDSLSSAENIFYYIQNFRLAMALYCVVWSAILLILNPLYILFMPFIELTKYSMGGFQVLGESLAVYPLIYALSTMYHTLITRKMLTLRQSIITSVSLFLSAFFLLPLWPAVAVIGSVHLYISLKKCKNIVCLVAPFLILTTLLFTVIPLHAWYKNTIEYSYKYFIPAYTEPTFTESLLLPLRFFVGPYNFIKFTTALLLIISLLNGYTLVRMKKSRIFVIFLVVLFASNPRIAVEGFHMLPWFAVLSYSQIVFLKYFWKTKDNFGKISSLMTVAVFFILTIYSVFHHNFLFTRRDKLADYSIYYSESLKHSNALNIISSDKDRLIVIPNDPLVYVHTNIKPASRLTEFYSWVYPIPEYHNDVVTVFEKNPPEFIIDTGLNKMHPEEERIMNILEKKYIRIRHVNEASKIYIRRDRYDSITEDQWQRLSYMLMYKNE